CSIAARCGCWRLADTVLLAHPPSAIAHMQPAARPPGRRNAPTGVCVTRPGGGSVAVAAVRRFARGFRGATRAWRGTGAACARRGATRREDAPGAHVFDSLALGFTRLPVAGKRVERQALVGDLCGSIGTLDGAERADFAAGYAAGWCGERVPQSDTG